MSATPKNPCSPTTPANPQNPWLPPELCEYYITVHDIYKINDNCRQFLRTEFHVLDYYNNLISIFSNLKEAEHACHINAVTL